MILGFNTSVLFTESYTNCITIRTQPASQRALIQTLMYAARISRPVGPCTYKRGPRYGVTWDAPRSPVWHRSCSVPSRRRVSLVLIVTLRARLCGTGWLRPVLFCPTLPPWLFSRSGLGFQCVRHSPMSGVPSRFCGHKVASRLPYC